ncbi:MAG: vitamin B12-dependent ribonucleotide reductase [Patescibacteria group bacterium]
MKEKIIKSFTPKLSPNALEVVKKRYLKLDKTGKSLETPAQMFFRVASFIAQADKKYIAKKTKKEQEKTINETIKKFYEILTSLKFLPGGRVLFEAGNKHLGQFSSCFVVPIPDSISGIFEALTNAAIIQQHNGGTGFNFSHIRPKGDEVRGVPNVAAGPIHYIKTFDTALSRVLQGSKRHGANIGILNINHPDIEEFIALKNNSSQLKNFNISVGVTDNFMEKLREDKDYELINPRTEKTVKKLRAYDVFNRIAESAWQCADPGLIFLNKLEATNPTPRLGKIEATNPCGEQPLLPYESCNLGHIVLANHIKEKKVGLNTYQEINWPELKKTIWKAVHFMDNMLDLNDFPLKQIKEKVLKTRKIGLGIMGFAQMLYKLKIPYNSPRAENLAKNIMKFIRTEGRKASSGLAKIRGVFPAWRGSIYEKENLKLRNATITTIAPTGTISMVANTSSGIEPVFSLVTMRRTFFEEKGENQASKTLIFIDPVFEETAKKRGIWSQKLIEKIFEAGGIQNIPEIPDDIKKVFVTAHDIEPEWHIKIQAAAQKYTDASVSKTINFKDTTTVEDIKRAYILAYRLGCKGITIYRDSSKKEQILNIGKISKKESLDDKLKTTKKQPVGILDEIRTVPTDGIKVAAGKKSDLSENAMLVLKKRALKKTKNGKTKETPDQLFWRVAKFVAFADKKYSKHLKKIKETEQEFYKMMKNLEFLSGQVLRNVGEEKLTLSACFVLPISDSIEEIMKTMTENIIVHKATGGTGINFSRLRSKNAAVGSTNELATGPLGFIRAFNAAQDTIRTKGGRKQGSMVILNINHPDIEEFIKSKDKPSELSNFNISVGIFDNFMEAVEKNKDYPLVDPHTKKIIKKVKANQLFNLIIEHAWRSADPGILFLDRIESDNPTPSLGKLETTNPCGEQPLLPYETCNLGSIVLSNMIKTKNKKNEIDFNKIKKVVKLAVHFLDNTIDLNNFPLSKMEIMTRQNRKIGLGVMGFADLLIKLGIPYNSDLAVKIAEKIMKFINQEARKASSDLGKTKGFFLNFKKSIWPKFGFKTMRNAAITTIAPTGYISIVAGCTSGIEPIFAIAYKRKNSLGGITQFEVHPIFEEIARKRGFWSEKLLEKIFQQGTLKNIPEIPDDIKKIFVTAHDIEPEWHIKIQAAFQKYTDNAVSKTINFKESTTVSDVAKAYKLAYKLGCKGVTIYRYGSKEMQVLSKGEKETKSESKKLLSAMPQPRPRPDIVKGKTYELKTAYGGLYVTINDDEEDRPFEVFATIGKAGGFFAAESEAICRLISLALRSGIPASQIVKQLKGIRGPMPSWTKKGTVFSIPDAIAKIIEDHIKRDQTKLPFAEVKKENNRKPATTEAIKSIETLKSNFNASDKLYDTAAARKLSQKESPISPLADIGYAPECPECGSILEFGEGCLICRACGYSKCG